MSAQTDELTEDEIEFDDNDNKIIQLYEVINELIDDQKARIEDMELLYQGKGDIALTNVEHRNNSVLNQIYTELHLTEQNDNDSDNSDSDDESEDEEDQGWEIYNTVVSNLNNYMAQIALFTQKLREQNETIAEGAPNAEDVQELESVVEQQTIALEQQMRRNEDLELALSSVLNEYKNRLNTGNNEIKALHNQLSNTNKIHSKQIQQLRDMYETKITELQQSTDNEYKNEVSKLIDSLSSSRNDFQKQIVALTQEMSDAQTSHHKEMLTLIEYNEILTDALGERTILVEELKQKQFNSPGKIRKTLRKVRTALDIDDEEEFYYASQSQSQTQAQNGTSKKKRTFQQSTYVSNSNSSDKSGNNYQSQITKPNGSNSKSALQAKYKQMKGYSSSNRSRNKKYSSQQRDRY